MKRMILLLLCALMLGVALLGCARSRGEVGIETCRQFIEAICAESYETAYELLLFYDKDAAISYADFAGRFHTFRQMCGITEMTYTELGNIYHKPTGTAAIYCSITCATDRDTEPLTCDIMVNARYDRQERRWGVELTDDLDFRSICDAATASPAP